METTAQRILAIFDQLDRDSLDLHTLFELIGGNAPAEREAVLDSVTTLLKQGLLRPGGGSDFYQRTEDGRLALAGSRDITLYMREGCHLCEEVKASMAPLLTEFAAKLQEVDIDDDPVLLERYTNDVPVIFVGSQFFAQHRLDLARLRQQLQQAKNELRR
jgi:glutaredoxin